MNEKPGDEAELPLLRRQDADAFKRLVQSHERIVLGLAQSTGFRGADLDDAAAEVFLAVYNSLPRFEARSSIGTWVYRIACRTLWNLRRRRPIPTAEAAEEVADKSMPSPAAGMEEAERNERLWASVARLDPRQAMTVELFYRRDWPIEKIAEALNCPAGTVKTMLFRAREQLRETLKRQEVGP